LKQECTDQFVIHPYRSKRLQPFLSMMSKDNTNIVFDDNVAAALSDQGYTWTDTPRSIYRVEKLYDALRKYEPGRIPDPMPTPELRQGISFARTCFARPAGVEKLKVRAFNFQTVCDITSNPSGSPGLTAWGATKAEATLRALERGHQILAGQKKPEPCISFKRTQFDDKTRLVWGYPYSMTAIEGLVAKSLNKVYKDSSSVPMAFGISDSTLGSKLRKSSRNNRYAYSIDMSAFDASISKFLIKQAFKIVKSWFDLAETELETGVTVGEIFNTIEDYFIHTPIVMPDGNVYYGKRHGVPSGSYFTQIIDSIVNCMIAGTLDARFNLRLAKSDTYILGDDLLLWSDRNIELGKLASFASKVFGVEFNPNKSRKFLWSEPIHFLGRTWTDGIPDESIESILARMLFPERFRHYSTDPTERERQVNLLLMSMASTYLGANCILRQRLRPTDGHRIHLTAMDSEVYDTQLGEQMDASFVSGNLAFKMRYQPEEDSRVMTSLVRQWIL